MDASRDKDGCRDRDEDAEAGVVGELSQSRREKMAETGTSGSKRNPDTHIRAKASKLTEGQTKLLQM
jgi:hypothetical protein